jgi:hypothetical protein
MVPYPKLLFLPWLGLYWLAVIAVLMHWRERLSGANPRLSKATSRQVGGPCELEVRQRYFKLVVWTLVLAFAPAYTVLSYARLRTPAAFWVVTILGGIVTVLGLLNAYRQIRAIHRLSIELEGKRAVAQRLDDVLSVEFHMFHDLPVGEGCIDHVVVGPTGIFAVETRTCSELFRDHTDAEYSVTVEGNKLCFSNGSEFAERPYLPDAHRKAKRLQVWLAVETGELVRVQPVVVLPACRIDRQREGEVPVLEETELDRMVKGPRVLQPTVIHRIARGLESRSRYGRPSGKVQHHPTAPDGQLPGDGPQISHR